MKYLSLILLIICLCGCADVPSLPPVDIITAVENTSYFVKRAGQEKPLEIEQGCWDWESSFIYFEGDGTVRFNGKVLDEAALLALDETLEHDWEINVKLPLFVGWDDSIDAQVKQDFMLRLQKLKAVLLNKWGLPSDCCLQINVGTAALVHKIEAFMRPSVH